MAGIDRRVAGKGSAVAVGLGVTVGVDVGMAVRVWVGSAVAAGSWKSGVLSIRR
jgi:hypothetical protein